MKKVRFIIAVLTALTAASCNSMKEGCYPITEYPAELQTASSVPLSGEIPEGMIASEVPQKSSALLASPLPEIAVKEEPGSDWMAYAAMPSDVAAPADNINDANEIRAIMAASLTSLAGTTDSRFASRVIKRTVSRLESRPLITEKSGFMHKLKAKVANKILPAIAAAPASGSDVLAIIALVTGILAFAYYAAFVLGVAAIITGAIALARGTNRRGMAIVGIVFGAIAIALWSGLITVL